MFKKITAAIAASVCCLGNPALATPQDYNDYQQITDKLNSVGVTVMVQQLCGPSSNILATYNSYTNVLCVTEAANNSDLLATVVRHEVVHVIQDCVAGMNNGKMGSVTRYLADGDSLLERNLDESLWNTLQSKDKLDHVMTLTNNLEADGAFVEFEAYGLEENHDAVFGLLDRCGS